VSTAESGRIVAGFDDPHLHAPQLDERAIAVRLEDL
jgi:hypothetical protein